MDLTVLWFFSQPPCLGLAWQERALLLAGVGQEEDEDGRGTKGDIFMEKFDGARQRKKHTCPAMVIQ